MNQPIGMKICCRCREPKPFASFTSNAARKDHLNSSCRQCTESRRRALRRMTPEERRQSRLRTPWVGDSKVCSKCGVKKPLEDFKQSKDGSKGGRSARCKECEKQWHAEHYRTNRDRILTRNKTYYAENADSVAISRALWWRENADRSREIKRERNARRRARILGSPMGDIDLSTLPLVDCYLCGLPINHDLRWPDPLSRSIDHVIPLSRGGAHAQFNLAWTHLRCNLSKGASEPSD